MNPKILEENTNEFPSEALRITLFEDRALVARRARIALRGGGETVALTGLSALVDDRTVQARIVDEPSERASVLSLRVTRRAARDQAEAKQAEDALREANAHALEAQQALDRAKRMETRASVLWGRWADALGSAPLGTSKPEQLDEWKAAHAAIEKQGLEAIEACVAAHHATMLADDERDHAEALMREAGQRAPRYEGLLLLQVEGEPGEIWVEISYQVPCALWRPEHWARLSGAGMDEPGQGAEPSIELVTWAAAWQCTGEAWNGVELWFSTARPARGNTAPLLLDDVLVARRKSEAERKRVRISARAAAGFDEGPLEGRDLGEMPGVDDGGEPLVFKAKQPVTFLSNGRPIRVELQRRKMPAEAERVMYPELSEAAHVRARAVMAGPMPLLAGPMRVSRGASLVGRSRVGFVGAGERFEMGFGADGGLSVRRFVDEAKEVTAVLGTQRIRRTVRLYVSNLSDRPRQVLLVERYFVSETDEVVVQLIEHAQFKLDEEGGFARAEILLSPQGTQALRLAYEVRASSAVVLPF